MAKDPLPLQQSALRGAEASQLLEHPLFQEIMAGQIEATTQALLATDVKDNDTRLALCVVLRTLRSFKTALENIKSSGQFDVAQLARMTKESRPDA